VTQPASPLHIADFRRLLVARCLAVLSSTGLVVVLAWQVYDVARAQYGMSPQQAAFQLGIIGLVQFVPLFLLSPFAGLAADRFDRRKLASLAMGIDAVMAIGLGTLTAAGLLNLPALFLLASLHGVSRAFFGPALSAIAPNILPAELLPRGIGMASVAFQGGIVTGPALAGLIYAFVPSAPYWAAVVMLLIGVIALLRIRPLPPHPSSDAAPLRQIAEGFRYVRRQKLLLGCVTLDLFAVLLAGATALLPVYARDILTWNGQPVGPIGLGQMRAAPAVGAILMGALLSWRPISRNVGVKMLLAVAVFGAATAVFGISRNYLLSLGTLSVLGAADMVSVFIRTTLVQLNTPDEMRGRVGSISGLAISASNELGEMQSGVAAALLGATGAVVFGGIGAIVVTGLWAVLFPQLRRSRTFASQYASPKEQAT